VPLEKTSRLKDSTFLHCRTFFSVKFCIDAKKSIFRERDVASSLASFLQKRSMQAKKILTGSRTAPLFMRQHPHPEAPFSTPLPQQKSPPAKRPEGFSLPCD
jgi:hypothetical protein